MISTDDIQHLLVSGGTVVGTDGDKIGKVGQLFLDDRTGDPEWVTVTTGLFGRAESFVPLADASVRGDEIVVPYDKATIKGAPQVDDSEGHLSPDEERELYRYYGFDDGAEGHDGDGPAAGVATGVRHDDADRDPDPHDPRGDQDAYRDQDAQRDEEAADDGRRTGGRHAADAPVDAPPATDGTGPAAGTATLATGGARLRRYVVTEEQTITVPVTREEVRVEPAPDADGAAEPDHRPDPDTDRSAS